MRKLFAILTLAILATGWASAKTVTIGMKTLLGDDAVNENVVTASSYTYGDFTFKFSNEGYNSDPTYYSSSNAVWLYFGNTLVITGGDGVNITKVRFNLSTDVTGELSCYPGFSYGSGSSEFTWELKSSEESTLTPIDRIRFTASASGKEFRIQSIVITYEEGAVKVPTFSIFTGSAVTAGTVVTLECPTQGASIYYTLDGSNPTTDSTPYGDNGIAITGPTTIKAIGARASKVSRVATARYSIMVNSPAFVTDRTVVEPGTAVELTADEGCSILYTTGEGDPDTEYTQQGIVLNESATIKAVAVDAYGNKSAVASKTYRVRPPLVFETVEIPYEETFATEFGMFQEDAVKLLDNLESIWTVDGYAQASITGNEDNAATESWLVSPWIEIGDALEPRLEFTEAADDRFFSLDTYNASAQVMVRTAGGEWTALNLNRNSGSFGSRFPSVNKTIDLSDYVFQTIQVAFVFSSDYYMSGTWRVSNFNVRDHQPGNRLVDYINAAELPQDVTIADTLTAVKAFGFDGFACLLAKDNNKYRNNNHPLGWQFATKSVMEEGQTDIIAEIWNRNSATKMGDYDQSNWVVLFLGYTEYNTLAAAKQLEGQTYTGITGSFTDNVNPMFEVTSWGTEVGADEYVPNNLYPAGFMQDNVQYRPVGDDEMASLFFMPGKPHEYCKLIWAQFLGEENGIYTFGVIEDNAAVEKYGITGQVNCRLLGEMEFTEGEVYNLDCLVMVEDNGGDVDINAPAKSVIVDPSYLQGPYTLYIFSEQAVTTGIDDVDTANATVTSVRYYNLAGQASSEAHKGVNIVVTEWSNGARTAAKVIK